MESPEPSTFPRDVWSCEEQIGPVGGKAPKTAKVADRVVQMLKHVKCDDEVIACALSRAHLGDG